MFTVGRGSSWAMFVVCRGWSLFVGTGGGPCCHSLGVCGGGPLLLLVVGGGGPSLLFMGAGSGPSSLLVVVVLVGCWWVLIAVGGAW